MVLREKVSLIPRPALTGSFELELVGAAKRVRLFVVIFSTMIRREFYAAPTVFQFWQDHQLPLLTHAADHLKLLAYAVEVVAPEDLRQANGKYVVDDPRINPQADRKSERADRHRPFVEIIDRAMLDIVQIFDENDFPYATGVLAEVSDCLRHVQLKLNDVCIVLDSWIEVLEKCSPKNTAELFPVRLKYSESRRRKAQEIIRNAFRSIRSNADILTICLNTRAATLAFFYEVALTSAVDESTSAILRSRIGELIELHEAALASCEEVSDNESDCLLQLAKTSIAWRCDDLLRPTLKDLPCFFEKHLRPQKKEVLEADFLADPAWLRSSKPITILAHLSEAKLGVSKTQLAPSHIRKVESRELRLIRSKLRHQEFAVRIVPDKCDSETASWDSYKKQLTIRVSASRGIDHLFLLVAQLLWAKLANSIEYPDLTEQLHVELNHCRLISVTEYVHTKLRYSSCLSLQLGRLDALKQLEKISKSLAKYSDSILLRSSSIEGAYQVTQAELEQALISNFASATQIVEARPQAFLIQCCRSELGTGTDRDFLTKSPLDSALWRRDELKRRILDHGLTRETLIQRIDALRAAK